MIYCDTSYLARLYLEDPGWECVRALCATDEIATSAHVQAELPGALHRALREGRLTPERFAEVIAQYDLDCAQGAYHWQPIGPSILAGMSRTYAALPATAFLRAADALHLACAAAHGFTDVWSNDRQFLAAAPCFGLRPRNAIVPASPP